MIFREAVIAFICGPEEKKEDEHCKTCRISAGRIGTTPDCKACNKNQKGGDG